MREGGRCGEEARRPRVQASSRANEKKDEGEGLVESGGEGRGGQEALARSPNHALVEGHGGSTAAACRHRGGRGRRARRAGSSREHEGLGIEEERDMDSDLEIHT